MFGNEQNQPSNFMPILVLRTLYLHFQSLGG
jgi:hypothetical protein